MKISNEYTQERVKALETKIRYMLTEVAQSSGESKVVLESMLNKIDYEELYLGVSLRMQQIYGYVVRGEEPVQVNYRCNPLFSQAGCILAEIPNWDVKVTADDAIEGIREIWLLQDMSLVSINRYGVYCNSVDVGCEYREKADNDIRAGFERLKLSDLEKTLQHLSHFRQYITSVYHIVTEDT